MRLTRASRFRGAAPRLPELLVVGVLGARVPIFVLELLELVVFLEDLEVGLLALLARRLGILRGRGEVRRDAKTALPLASKRHRFHAARDRAPRPEDPRASSDVSRGTRSPGRGQGTVVASGFATSG